MKDCALLFMVLFLCSAAVAQDSYHNNLQNTFKNDYGLPDGTWVLHDNESAIIDGAGAYNAQNSTISPTDQIFSKAVRFVVNAGGNAWDSGWNIKNNVKISKSEKVLLTFWIRADGAEGEVNVFGEDAVSYDKEAYLTLTVSNKWQQYFLPYESSATFETNQLAFGFHLANKSQTVEIGGFTVVKFPASIPTNQLPNKTGTEFYGGYEDDAPWRAKAADQIDQLRKANLNILVKKPDGTLLEGATVSVKMLQHNFAWGSAITAARIAGNNDQNNTYENKIINLDGKGHGFNWIVFENDMKWRAWEDNWFVSNAELANAVQWLGEKNIKIRGHNLIWPGSSYLPSDVVNKLNDPSYVKQRYEEHIEEIINFNGLQGEIEEWDILNEIATNRDFENTFKGQAGYPTGREVYQDIYKKAREEDPNTGLWINDYVTLSLKSRPGNTNYDNLKKFTKELVDANVELEGIGFQGHIGGSLNSIPDVLATFDDFYNEFGLKAKITEFDIDALVDDDLGATYLRDFLTATFSHPSMDGFLMWGFWDNAHWKNNAPMYYSDWKIKPTGETFVDMVFNQWWTEETATTIADGTATVRGFKGLYEISYHADGELVTDVINLLEDMDYEIVSENLPTNTEAPEAQLPVLIYPNPTTGELRIEYNTNDEAVISIYDLTGKKLMETTTQKQSTIIDLSELKGLYLLEYRTAEGRSTQKISVY